MWILCLAEDSHEISSFIFSEKQWKYTQDSSAAVMVDALRVKDMAAVFKYLGKQWKSQSIYGHENKSLKITDCVSLYLVPLV